MPSTRTSRSASATASTRHTASVTGISQALEASHSSCCRCGCSDRTNRRRATTPAATTLAATPASSTSCSGTSASGSAGSGLATPWKGSSNGSGVNNPVTTVPTRQTAATHATGRQRLESSRPSGKTKARATTPPNIVTQLALAHSTAQSPAGRSG